MAERPFVQITPFELAERFIGTKEVPGSEHNPQVMAMLKLDMAWPEGDEVPWCSAFVNYVFWLLRLPRSKSLRARSWLNVGAAQNRHAAEVGFDVVILSRGKHPQPGPEVIAAPGHVGLYAGAADGKIHLLGGNQGNEISVRGYDMAHVLGVRRIFS